MLFAHRRSRCLAPMWISPVNSVQEVFLQVRLQELFFTRVTGKREKSHRGLCSKCTKKVEKGSDFWYSCDENLLSELV